MGVVLSGAVGGWGCVGFVTLSALIASGDVSVLLVFDNWSGRAGIAFAALSSGVMRLVVSLI